MRFRKKPVVIEAVQWDPSAKPADMPRWFWDHFSFYPAINADNSITIATLEGKGPDDLPGLRDEVLACGSTTMGTNESRLRCMLKKPPEGPWDLNDEDRTAIQWAFDRIETLEQQLNERRTEQIEWLRRSNRGRDKVKSAIETLKESLQ